jgi:hypothetical protein
MSPIVVGAVVFGGVGVLLMGLGVPLARRRIAPNGLYGLRCRETLSDAAVWYEANAVQGRGHVALGAGLLALAGGLPLLGISPQGHALVCLVWLVVGVLALCVGGVASARRMAARRSGVGGGVAEADRGS